MPLPAWKLSRALLRNLFSTAKKVYPDEFIAMLGVSEQDPLLLHEMVILPAEFGRTHSQLRYDLMPFDPLIVGTVHSHPSRSMRPSSADLRAFSGMGKVHLILGYPYEGDSYRAYSSLGRALSMDLV